MERRRILVLVVMVALLDNALHNTPLTARAHQLHTSDTDGFHAGLGEDRSDFIGADQRDEDLPHGVSFSHYMGSTRDHKRISRNLQDMETAIITKQDPCTILTPCSNCAGSSEVTVQLGRLNTNPTTDVHLYFLTKTQYDAVKQDCGDPDSSIRNLGVRTDWGKQEFDLGSALKKEGDDSEAPYIYVKAGQPLGDDDDVKVSYVLQYKVSNGSSNTGLIIGIVVGVFVVGIAIGLLGLCYWRQKQDEFSNDEDADWESHDIFSSPIQETAVASPSPEKGANARIRNNVAWISRNGQEVRNPV